MKDSPEKSSRRQEIFLQLPIYSLFPYSEFWLASTQSLRSNWDFSNPWMIAPCENRVISDLTQNHRVQWASSISAHERVTGVAEATELLCQGSSKDSKSLEMMIHAFLRCCPKYVPPLKAMWEILASSQYPKKFLWHKQIFPGVPDTISFCFSLGPHLLNAMYLFLLTPSNCNNYIQRKDITRFCSCKIIVIV